MLDPEKAACRTRCFLTLLYRLNGCGIWLTLIALPLSLLWVWFHDLLHLAAPHAAYLTDLILFRIDITTLLVLAASWLLGRFRNGRMEAKNSLNSGC